MTDKEKIRAYVKRLQKPEGYGDYWKGYDSVLNDILSFIDSLQEEPVDKCKGCNNVKGCITCVDGDQWAHYEEPVSEGLEEASKEWLRPQLDKSYAAYGETKQMEFTHFDGYAMLDAIEFGAKWGKNQAMAEIQAQSMALAHGCPEEPASEELIDVAKQYVKEHVIGIDKFTFSIATDMFISGAKWKEHQMMSKAFPVEIDSSRSDGRCILSGNFARFETGDKVKVIVIKED